MLPRPRDFLISLTLGAVVASLAFPPAAAGQGSKPIVSTALVIKAPHFVDNLKESRRGVETHVATELALKAETHFQFLSWLRTDGSAEPVDAELELQLVTEQRQYGAAVLLKYVARIAGKELALPQLPAQELYDVYDDQPSHSPSLLRQDLVAVVQTDFANDSFLRKLHKQFLRKIPIANQVHVHEVGESIVVPFAWADLQATQESQLRVEFEGEGPAASTEPAAHGAAMASLPNRSTGLAASAQPLRAKQEGNMGLDPVGEIELDAWRGMVQCNVAFFSFPPIRVSEVGWDDRIPGVLAEAQSLRVFMEKYELDTAADVRDGTVGEY